MDEAKQIDSFLGEFAFLSNFYPHPVVYAGSEWKTAEHAYQAAKTMDVDEWLCIRKAETPGRAKRLGRSKENGGIVTLRKDWPEVRVSVMRDILAAKFKVPALADKLRATGTMRLVEGNTWGDTFWGVDIRTRVGQNTLGKLLMQIREDMVSFS